MLSQPPPQPRAVPQKQTTTTNNPLGVPLQLGKIVERVGAVELAGMDQVHIQVAYQRPVPDLIEQRVFAVQNGLFRERSAKLLSNGVPALARNSVSRAQ